MPFAPLLVASAQQLRDACGTDPGWLCRRVFDITGDPSATQTVSVVLGKPLAILAILVGAVVANRIVRRVIRRGLRTLQSGAVQERIGAVRRRTPQALLETQQTSLRAEQRIEALTSVLRSVASFTIFLVAGLMVLGQLGINLAPLLAGAGILGIAFGFGSQALVRDFLSGVFILIEDQFGVGDIADVGGVSGTVEAVSLRTTRLRAVDGTVWHVPNGDIRRVGNMSQHWSRSLLDLEVAYDADVELAQDVIREVACALHAEDRDILEEPEVWGIEAMGAQGVVIRLVVKTTPSEQWRISRTLRQRIKAAFEEHGIDVPFPQHIIRERVGADDR